jgi:hypothetical protein
MELNVLVNKLFFFDERFIHQQIKTFFFHFGLSRIEFDNRSDVRSSGGVCQ